MQRFGGKLLKTSLSEADELEDDMLDKAWGLEAESRLSCQALVDDEDLVRMSTADMLADLGYAVIEAGSAEEAVRLLAGDRMPDIVVTDHLMPGMTGAELARHIGALRALSTPGPEGLSTSQPTSSRFK